MGNKSWLSGIAVYSGYLAVLGAIWAGVASSAISSATGICLGILAGAAMAIYWPRW
ncbi:MAG: hypothetical protein ACOY35_06240 [Bacillota bacterium]